jgi:hypothetical protein
LFYLLLKRLEIYDFKALLLKGWLNKRLRWMDDEIQSFNVAEHPINIADVEIFPNPSVSSENVRFAYHLFIDADVELQLFNMAGQLISQQKVAQ